MNHRDTSTMLPGMVTVVSAILIALALKPLVGL